MNINKDQYKKIQNRVEEDLKSYPYFLISIETPKIVDNPEDEYKKTVVNAIEFVYSRLDKNSKKIIEAKYFKDDVSMCEIMDELKIDKNKYYKLRKDAIYKFAVGFGYC